MLAYIIRRIIVFIPTLVIISLVAFTISSIAPGDPVDRILNASENGDNKGIKSELFKQKRHELGLDLPLFYFKVGTLADSAGEHKTTTASWKNYIPSIHFYGINNQYHRWVTGILFHGDFGTSYQSQMPVVYEIRSSLPWSLVLSLLSVIIAFGISIPIGMYAARYRGGMFDKGSAIVLFIMYSLPSFFVATMLLVFFANPHFLNWFPESGVQDALNFDNNWPFWVKVQHWAPYLILPLIAYTYSSIAFLSRQMRAGALEIFDQEYIKAARAKGLSESRLLWKHVFRNSLMPIITVFAHVFPAAITGSIIVETIFAIPGMGREIYEAVFNYNYPVIIAVFTIFGFLTLVGYLVSDILYAIADPRINYSKK